MKQIILSAILVLLLTACGGGSGGSDAPAPQSDTTAPTVESFYPDPTGGEIYASDIQTYGVYVIFDEGMEASTITGDSFTLIDVTSGNVKVSGAVTYETNVRTARFVPDSALNSLYTYTATVTTAATDLSGNHLTTPYSRQFQIAAPTPPGPPM